MKKLWLLILLPILSLASCIDEPVNLIAIPFHVTDSGISVGAAAIEVGNFSPGRHASVIYRIYNDTENTITPDIFPQLNVDPTKYSKAEDYSPAPADTGKWLKIEDSAEIQPGEYKNFTVRIEMPKNASVEADKWAYRVGVAGGVGGFTQTAVSVWWLIDMR